MSSPTMPSAPVAGDQVPWPNPPREPGPWDGGPPIAPPGNTPLPPLPGAGGVVHGGGNAANPWSTAQPPPEVNIPPSRVGPPPTGPAEPPAPLVDRAPTAVLVLAGLILAAGIAGLVYVVVAGGRSYPDAWDDRVAPIAEEVADLRELDFEHPVEVNFLSEEEYSARATEGADDSVEATAYYDDQAAQLRALGLLEGDVDLGEANDTLNDAGTLAFYDPTVEQVYVRGTEITPALRVTLAHELVHVLQDQHFDLERFDELTEDGRAASLRALAEGDAEHVEDAYVSDVLTDDERAFYAEETRAAADGADEGVADVPPVLTTFFAAPYILGPRTIAYLDEEGGQSAIDEALQDPPTEEELFNPLLLGSDAAEIRGDLTAEVPEGGAELERGDFGPTAWYLVLDARLDSTQAIAAVDGWGGDEYAVYRDGDDRVCVAASVIGDDEEATARLGDALTAWVDGSPADTAEISVDAGVIRFRSCDPGAEAEATGDAVTPDALAVPTVRTDLYLEAVGAGLADDDATCLADGVVRTIPSEKILDGYLQTEASTADIQALRSECGF
ncbi:MAG: hypothetical protein KDA98_01840 [Acidimicrobiales bacterium]|nr:hypothetical protein [Acidimicrobiales bacterium]